jgi:hypothetical protein
MNDGGYMSTEQIYIKTPLGIDEIQNRTLNLPPRLRTMLIMIDGHKPLSVLKESAAKFSCPEDFIESLLATALIAKLSVAESPSPVPGAIATASLVSSGSNAAAAIAAAPTMPEQPIQDEYARFRIAKDFMNSAVVNSLGIKAFFFTLKLERAGTVDDLRGLVKPFQDALTKATNAAEADELTKQLLEYLG